jgi:hypothetical protein
VKKKPAKKSKRAKAELVAADPALGDLRRKRWADDRPAAKSGALRKRMSIALRADLSRPDPAVKNPERRESCRLALLKFGYTYFPKWCYRAPSPIIIEYTDRLQEMIIVGGRSAIAVPRSWAQIAAGSSLRPSSSSPM